MLRGAISAQLHYVYATCLLGTVADGSMFGAQIYGSKDMEGFRQSIRFLACLALAVIAFVILALLVR